MSSAEPQNGDRVKVTYVGKYEKAPDGYPLTSTKVRDDAGRAHFYYPGSNITVEVVEPAYIPGEVYEDAKGDKYLRLPGPSLIWRPLGWRGVGRYPDVGEDYPTRPLRKLVPENG